MLRLLLCLFSLPLFAQITTYPQTATSAPTCGSPDCTVPGTLGVTGASTFGSNVTIGTTVLTTGQTIDVVCSGNIGAALNAAIATLDAADGGTVRLSSGSCYSSLQLLRTAVKNVRLTGQGATFDGIWDSSIPPTSGGTQLDLRYAGGPKIYTSGKGTMEIDHISFVDSTDGTQPFVFSSYTTMAIHQNAFWGKTPFTPAQDAIVLGDRTTGGTVVQAVFQGYGTVIEQNYFGNIRRGVYLQKFANAVVIQNNTWSSTCGADSSAGAIEIDGIDTSDTGATVIGNLVEVLHYVYGVRLTALAGRNFFLNHFYDPSVGTLAQYYFSADSTNNTVITGEGQGFAVTAGAGAANNLVLDAYLGHTAFPAAVSIAGTLSSAAINAAGSITVSGSGHGITMPAGEAFSMTQAALYTDGSGNIWYRRIGGSDYELIDSNGNIPVGRLPQSPTLTGTVTAVNLRTSTGEMSIPQGQLIKLNGSGGTTGFYADGSGNLFLRAANHDGWFVDNATGNLASNGGAIKFAAGTTGSTTATLGSNSPAVTATPNTWVSIKLSDGSTAYIPAWK